MEISAPGDLNLTPPRIRNNSYSDDEGDLSKIRGVFGGLYWKKESLVGGSERYSEIGFQWLSFKRTNYFDFFLGGTLTPFQKVSPALLIGDLSL